MSEYTTGEMARLCGVSVRTVQYYDSRSILIPSRLSEGGRRLYSEDDLHKLQIICFLRELGFSIDHISTLFSDESSTEVLSMLIGQQEKLLSKELQERTEKLQKLTELKRHLKSFDRISTESLGGIAHVMRNQKKRRKMILWMLLVGILMDLIEIGTVIYGIRTGVWWPLVVGAPLVIGLGVFISWYYYSHARYICPSCHRIFQPTFRAAFCAYHTPNTRRLTCIHCGHRGLCVETCEEGTS